MQEKKVAKTKILRDLAIEKAKTLQLPDIEPEFIEIANDYLERSKKRDMWDIYLHGLSATHELHSGLEKEIYDGLKETLPNPETARKVCKERADAVRKTVIDTYNKTAIAKYICETALRWDEFSNYLKKCDLQSIAEKIPGFSFKGADMVGLLAGCDTIVLDRHMFYHIIPEGTEEDHDLVRASKTLYALIKDIHREQAKKLNLPSNLYHTALWLKRVKQTPEQAREWVNEVLPE